MQILQKNYQGRLEHRKTLREIYAIAVIPCLQNLEVSGVIAVKILVSQSPNLSVL